MSLALRLASLALYNTHVKLSNYKLNWIFQVEPFLDLLFIYIYIYMYINII